MTKKISQAVGHIITFYSFKGGTGRTMTLANIACLLARRQLEGNKILMVDWDLEAPGLPWFFANIFQEPLADVNTLPPEFQEKPGLIDLFYELDELTQKAVAKGKEQSEEAALELVQTIELEKFIISTEIPGLDLLKGGRFGEGYSQRVNTFDWEALYNRSPWLMTALAHRLAEQYRYVLIDSRTGITDTSGICTRIMPEILVIVFTPNRQSLTGVLDLIRRAVTYRKQSDDIRPLVVFPLPSRIDISQEVFYKDWRYGNRDRRIIGYQPQFEEVFEDVYQLPRCNLKPYFDDAQIQYVSDYAYGEKISVLDPQDGGRLDITKSYEDFLGYLLQYDYPWEESTTKYFDVFMVYSAQDKAQVVTIAEKLSQQGLTPWIDIEQLRPGKHWRDNFLEAIFQAESVAMFIGPGGPEKWQMVELKSFIRQSIERGIPVIPVLLPGIDEVSEEWQFLEGVHGVNFKSLEDTEALDKLIWGITGKPPHKKRTRSRST
ncbi:TIR domain-containing protein [candidate division KSB3 bacterium]|nr:TIR domain-containing protein [candidate division KSB3 bacterium]